MNTPRTDANDLGWQFNEQYGDFDALSDTPMPWLDFSKMLEEELTAVTDERDALRDIFPRILIALQSGNCAADCSVDFLQMIPKEVELVRKRLQQELKEVTEQRDRLAEALERILDYQGRFAEEDPESIAKEALQSLTTTEP